MCFRFLLRTILDKSESWLLLLCGTFFENPGLVDDLSSYLFYH